MTLKYYLKHCITLDQLVNDYIELLHKYNDLRADYILLLYKEQK